MKHASLILILLFSAVILHAQDMKNFKLYKPDENAAEGLQKAVTEAKAKGKNVFVQIGGNWCIWCARFHEFVNNDPQLDSLVKADYVVYHLNYSPENRNKEILARFGFPQRFGFPVFIVLDGNGNRLHTQNSALLEEGKGYNKNKVMTFLKNWNTAALDAANYKNY